MKIKSAVRILTDMNAYRKAGVRTIQNAKRALKKYGIPLKSLRIKER